jgi:hypothetical protein
MKQLFNTALFILLFQLSVNGQNPLKNREIYNFEVGDVIHVELTCNFCEDGAHGIRYLKRHFLSKQMSQDQDTVFFEVLDSLFKLSGRPGWQVKAETHVISYHSLDSVAKLFDQSPDLYMEFDFPDTTTFTFQNTYQHNDSVNEVYYIRNRFDIDQFWESLEVTTFKNYGSYYDFNFGVGEVFNRTKKSKLLYLKSGAKEYGQPILNLLAQKQLSNREIYNFEVGDIIHFTKTPGRVETIRHIISKSLSANNDTVKYSVLDTVLTHSANGIKLEVKHENLTYNKLDSFPKTYNFDSPSSSGYFEFSYKQDANTHINFYYYFGGWPDEFYDYYYEGLGRYGYYTSRGNIMQYSSLNYYKKGNTSWGNPLSVQKIESGLLNQINIYPNPASDEITLTRESSPNSTQVQVYDMQGKKVFSTEWKDASIKINTQEWRNGIYTVRIGEQIVRKVVIQK